jgi:hypothetical protein
MEKHRTADIQTVKSKVTTNAEAWNKYMEIMSLSNFDVIIKKATELYRTKICHRHIRETFEDIDPKWREDRSLLTVPNSIKIVEQ